MLESFQKINGAQYQICPELYLKKVYCAYQCVHLINLFNTLNVYSAQSAIDSL